MNIKNIIIGLAITILASFVAIYGIKAFYGDTPQYDDFCKDIVIPQIQINSSEQCTSYNGKWISYEYAEPKPISEANGYCNFYEQCSKEYDTAQKKYSKNLFLVTIPVGVILIAIGAILFSLEAIGAGIMLGGVVTLIFGAGSFWPDANNLFRFLISLIGLIGVIIIGYWINKERKKIFK
jgi:hypothetical protein